ncbi:ABC transporter ATP-binding protein [Paenibacillus periandrae]|uniref:ABC transporter ATP-binding protein n=1 Tax=Paenibacillus periandrae TaxID=1761741 RepID=UPI001F098BDC|nr:ABC transporter ATP-binding protein [Paenibacillus periandrae]
MGAQQNDIIQDSLVDACKRQLIEDGKLVLTDSGYRLTARGREAVMKELRRYELRPAMAMMLEIHVLNQHEHSVW